MTQTAVLYLAILLATVVILVKPLGWYIAQVYSDKPCVLNRIFKPFENLILRICGIDALHEMDWKEYLTAMLLLNMLGLILLYLIQRLQFLLPFNPEAMPAVAADLAFNTAASFVTNTDWQAYAGEASLSYFTQMFGLTVQNFISAASGMSVLIAFTRGLTRQETTNLGNFWSDTLRGVMYILLPLAILLAVFLTSQGVIQNFKPYEKVHTLQTGEIQTIAMGPVASQIAIKQIGSNGGGFFNTNSAHPFENPTPLTNLINLIAVLLIPAALCYTFGIIIKDRRQGWIMLISMLAIFIPCVCATVTFELQGNPTFKTIGLGAAENMEGKETRFGVIGSAIYATATTAVSNGSVNSMLDSFTPLGGMVCLMLIHLGEIVFGGVGSGLYGMVMLVIITVFVSGLMVGRTPEYLGKKIEPFDIKMAVVTVLVMPLVVLLLTAIAVVTPAGLSAVYNPGAHGFTEILYAFSSFGGNNGSALAGLNTNNFFYNISGAIVMLISRYWIAIATLAVAGSLVQKKRVPVSPGTLETHTPLFLLLLIGVIFILGALSFFPGLALGPIAEHLMLWGKYVY